MSLEAAVLPLDRQMGTGSMVQVRRSPRVRAGWCKTKDFKASGTSRTRTQQPVQGRNIPLGCNVAESEDNMDTEKNSNGIVAVSEVRLQVLL